MAKLTYKTFPEPETCGGHKSALEHTTGGNPLPNQESRFAAMEVVDRAISSMKPELSLLGYDLGTIKFSIKAKKK